MAAFAKKTFDAAGYLASRPTYPAKIYDVIVAYHSRGGGQFDHAVDVGCGPALNLAPHFKQVSAFDPSANMVAVGLQNEHPATPISYAVASAESLPLPDSSADLVVAGQAAHWFDHSKTWKELRRVLKPGGTVAYIGYGEASFSNRPAFTALHNGFMHGPELDSHWSQPGRSICEGLLDAVPFPVSPTEPSPELLESLPSLAPNAHPIHDRITEPASTGAGNGWDPSTALRLKAGTEGGWAIQRKWTADRIAAYMRTCSALHSYQAAHPEDKARQGKGGAEGDVVDRTIEKFKQGMAAEGVSEVEVEWPLILLLLKRRNS